MRKLPFLLTGLIIFASNFTYSQTASTSDNQGLDTLAERFYEEDIKLYPLLATSVGDNRYNDLLTITFTDSFCDSSKRIWQGLLTSLNNMKRASLDQEEKINYDVLKWHLEMKIEKQSLKDNLLVFTQSKSLPDYIALMGSGTLIQPFKTVKDYENWLKRATLFSAWSDK